MKNLLSHKQLLTKSNEALMLNNSLNELIEKMMTTHMALL